MDVPLDDPFELVYELFIPRRLHPVVVLMQVFIGLTERSVDDCQDAFQHQVLTGVVVQRPVITDEQRRIPWVLTVAVFERLWISCDSDNSSAVVLFSFEAV